MQYSTNYNMNKPELTDQYDVAHWNQNTDIIDTELKKREDDDTALKNPAYTVPASDDNLVSGEGFQTAFGKIAKAISSFITHKGETTSVHGSTSAKTVSKIVERDANGRAKVADGVDIDDITTLEQIQNSALSKKFIGVKTVATSNITLFGEQVIDSLSCVVNDIILVINQTTATENGIYIVQTGAWTRHSDYDTADKINNTLIGAYKGTNVGKVYKATTATYTEGTTVLSFNSADYPMPNGAKWFWRKKINASEEYRPAIGIPTMWFGTKPNWALDFGNGASTKYLWTNYPELWNNAEFKDTLQLFVDKGWMSQFDTVESGGFYVPDLRGMFPMAYGLNAVRTGETYHGSDVGEFQISRTKYHNHSFSGTNVTDSFNTVMFNTWTNKTTGFYRYTKDSMTIGWPASGSSWGLGRASINYTPAGTVNYAESSGRASKPGSVSFMWIVRFE